MNPSLQRFNGIFIRNAKGKNVHLGKEMLRVTKLLLNGKTQKQVASRRTSSPNTIGSYITKIRTACEVSSNTELVQLLIARGVMRNKFFVKPQTKYLIVAVMATLVAGCTSPKPSPVYCIIPMVKTANGYYVTNLYLDYYELGEGIFCR